MLTAELNSLVDVFNHDKDILDNHTAVIVDGIREWCLNERARQNKEMSDLREFVKKNLNLFKSLTYKSGSSVSFYYLTWNGLEIRLSSGLVDRIGLSSDWQYKKHFGTSWTDLPKPTHHSPYHTFNDDNNTTLDYWVDYKIALAIYNEYNNEVIRIVKDYLNTLILGQEARKDAMVKACNEICEDNDKNFVEVKFSAKIRV